MEQIARATLPKSMDFEWTNLSFQEKKVGNQAIGIFALAVLLVYLVLAAQYESWLSPLAVIRADHCSGQQERDPDRGVRP
jgi:HAE1 family hydrophobic/amphiphilic exporter-1